MKELYNKCGIGYIHGYFLDAYNLIQNLEHRGQEAAGIAGINNEIKVIRWLGKTSEKNKEEIEALEKYFKKYNEFLVHTRYATFGSKEELLKGAQPITTSGFKINGKYSYSEKVNSAIVHNGQLVSIEDLSKEFDNLTGSDTEFLLRMCERDGIEKVMEDIPAAYSAIISDKEKVTGFRDRYGIRPLWYGEKDGFPMLASEDACIKKVGGKPVREIKPGEVVYIEGEEINFEKLEKTDEKFCFFEFNYLADPSSNFNGKNVGEVRKELGKKLAKEVEIKDADLVIPVPNSGNFYAIGYQEESGLPCLEILKKNTAERSFIQSTKEDRKMSIEFNLYLENPEIVKNKKLVIIDDSIVRGNVIEKVVKESKKGGVEKIYFCVGTPPIGKEENAYCCYGVDMPSTDEFLIRRFGNEKSIAKYLSEKYKLPVEVHYISKKSLFGVLGDEEKYCTQCITGKCPVTF